MRVEVRFTKWGGEPHWRYPLEALGTDEHGWWLGGRAGITMRRGSADSFVLLYDIVTLIPADGCWIATWNAPGSSDFALYVDVTTRPVRHPDAADAVDLDLDVVRRRDGTVEVLDEDEFAEHQVRYAYPAEVIAQAEATTADLVARIAAGIEPFGADGATWLASFAGPPSQ